MLNKYKNSTLFLVKFFVAYFLLFAIYAVYLNNYQVKDNSFQCAPITAKVADQTVSVLNFFGYNVTNVQHEAEMSVKLTSL